MKRPRVRSALALASLALTSCTTTLEPRRDVPAEVRERYSVDDLAEVLREHVDDAGRVDYAALVADGEALERQYARIAAIGPDDRPELFPTEADRLAYWINAYNTAVLALIRAHYPIASVRDVSRPWLFFFLPRTSGFFYFQRVRLGGQAISLYALENDVVRGRFAEPRIHFALNCGSVGCPRLPREPFRPEGLDEQLERETRRFFAEERNLRIDHERRTVFLSQILEWYASDFTDRLAAEASEGPETPGTPATVLEYVVRHVDDATAAELRGRASTYAVEYVPYDWGLNDSATAGAD